jgi:hypothetical protein
MTALPIFASMAITASVREAPLFCFVLLRHKRETTESGSRIDSGKEDKNNAT